MTEKVFTVFLVVKGPSGGYSVSRKTFAAKDAANDFVREESERIARITQGAFMGPGMRDPAPMQAILASLGIAGFDFIMTESEVHQSNLVVPKLVLPHN